MRVCLDLGTAFSKASLYLGDGLPAQSAVAPLPIGAASGAEHSLLTPSALYIDNDRVFFGPGALERARSNGMGQRLPIISFKMVLSARGVEATLASKLSRAFDPTSTLCNRDALVAYLAYLDQLVRAAVTAESSLPRDAAGAPRRITSPLWRGHNDIARTVGRLVEEAASVSAALGPALLDHQGVPVGRMMDALAAARGRSLQGAFDGVVFEAQSAASAYVTFAASRAQFVFVVDMGAGTTDIAAFERCVQSVGAPLTELAEARQWCTLAGDELDHIVIELFMRAKKRADQEAQSRLWRALRLSAHRLKRELLLKGKATFDDGGKKLVVTRTSLLKDSCFKDYCRALSETIGVSLKPVADQARQAGARSINVLLAGGGSNMSFMADLVRGCGHEYAPDMKLEVEPFGANWALPHRYHPFAGAFPQMAISIGGALADVAHEPETLAETA